MENYTNFTRDELFTLIREQRTLLFNLKTGAEQPSERVIQEVQTDLDDMLAALRLTPSTATRTNQKENEYSVVIRQQAIRDVLKQQKLFRPGNDVNQFITALNKAYTIHVAPELERYPSLEGEFVKSAKDLLDQGIFQQMVDSKSDSSTFEELKEYLQAAHGSQMTSFQHLSRAWDLERIDGEKLPDFASRLENTLRDAAVHIKTKFKKDKKTDLTVDGLVSIIGAMLMSEKVKTWTPNIYTHLVKTMDNHYNAIGIACEAQRYIDRGVKSDVSSPQEAYYTQKSQQSYQDEASLRTTLSPQLSRQPHQRGPVNQHPKQDRPRGRKGRQHNSQTPLCRNYLGGRPCFRGHNCPFRHPPRTQAQAHIAAMDDDQTFITQDFPFGQDEM